jgi:hypothetical protein
LTRTAEVEQAVYRVDSILGLLLAVLTFESNLVIGQGTAVSLSMGATLAQVATIGLLIEIFLWILGVLLQQWYLKFFAWYGTVFLLIFQTVNVILVPLRLCCGLSLDPLGIFGILFVESNLSVIFCWFVVRQAYVLRLVATKAQRQAKEISDLATGIYRLIAFGASLVLFFKLIGLL